MFTNFPSGCCFALLRPDAVPFGRLRCSEGPFLVFLEPLRVLFGLLWDSLGSLLSPLPSTAGRGGVHNQSLGGPGGPGTGFL